MSGLSNQVQPDHAKSIQVKPSPASSSPIQQGQAKSSHQQSPVTDSHQSPTITSPQQSPVTHSHQSPTVTIRHQPSHGKPVPPQTASPTGPIKLKRLNNTVRHKGGTYNNTTVRQKGGTYNNQDYTKIVRSRKPHSLYHSNVKCFNMNHDFQVSRVMEGLSLTLFSGCLIQSSQYKQDTVRQK